MTGTLGDAELQVEAPVTNVWMPLFLSVSIHLVIGWWLLTPRDIERPAVPAAGTITLRMVPANPVSQEAIPVEAPSADPADAPVSAPAAAEPDRSPLSLSPHPALAEEPAVDAPEPTPDPASLQIPSVLSLRRVIEDTPSRQEQQSPGFTCSPLQLENDILDCSNRMDSRFENVPNNPVVELFQTDPEPSRLENAARLTSIGAEEIGTNLRAAGISDAYIGRLMNQLESIAKEYTAPENEKTEILRDEMLRSDPVWQQRKRAMNPR